MQATPTAPTLRPLSLGEILDRAVNLCVKHVVTLSLIAVAFLVPLGVAHFFGFADASKVLGALVEAARASSEGKTPDNATFDKVFEQSPVLNVWTAVWFLIFLVGSPLVTGATVIAVATAYFGGMPTFAESYRRSLRRVLHVLGVNLMFSMLGGLAEVILFAIAFVLILAFAAVGQFSQTAAWILVGLFGLIFALALVALGLVIFLAWQMAIIGVMLEPMNFAESFLAGLRRVFYGVGFRRALVVGLAYVAIYLGISLVAGLGAVVVLGIVKNHALGEAFTVLVQIVSQAFTTAVMTIFYFDLRVREEGLDLQLAAHAAATQTGPTLTTA